MTDLLTPALKPGSPDFMSLVTFRRKWVMRGGSFTEAFQTHPPVFFTPELRRYETNLAAFAVLMDAHITLIDEWWAARRCHVRWDESRCQRPQDGSPCSCDCGCGSAEHSTPSAAASEGSLS